MGRVVPDRSDNCDNGRFFSFILNFYLCDGELQTDGRQTAQQQFSSHINQTYTTTLLVWCPSFHPQFFDRFVLFHYIFAYFIVWTLLCSQTVLYFVQKYAIRVLFAFWLLAWLSMKNKWFRFGNCIDLLSSLPPNLSSRFTKFFCHKSYTFPWVNCVFRYELYLSRLVHSCTRTRPEL